MWGCNDSGQLGTGDKTDHTAPQLVIYLKQQNLPATLSLGMSHSAVLLSCCCTIAVL